MKSQVILPPPPKSYDANDQAQVRRAIAAEDLRNVKSNDYASATSYGIIKVNGPSTDTAAGYTEGTWTPTDGSGASLSLTITRAVYRRIGNLVFIQAVVVYPATGSGANAKLGGLPFAVAANGGGSTCFLTVGGGMAATSAGTSNVIFITTAGAGMTNAALSGGTIQFAFVYPAT